MSDHVRVVQEEEEFASAILCTRLCKIKGYIFSENNGSPERSCIFSHKNTPVSPQRLAKDM